METTSLDSSQKPILTTQFEARTVLLFGLLLIGLLFALRTAQDFFMPVTLAIVLHLLLRPVVRFLERLHIPPAVGAALILLCLSGAIFLAVVLLNQPASEWIAKTPQTIEAIEKKVTKLLKPLVPLQQITERLRGGQPENQEAVAEEETKSEGLPIKVSASPASLRNALSITSQTAATLTMAVILLYFLMSSGDLFLVKMVRIMPNLQDKKRAVEISHDMEARISHYLFFVTCINAGLGTCVGLSVWAWGMSNPLLWGTMAFLINYIPYLGGSVGIAIVAVVSLLSFESAAWALLPPLSYFVFFFIEGNFVTPSLLGRGMKLNPAVIFVWLMLWSWLWGIAGALLAVPLLVILKIFCDHFESLAPLGEFLAD